MYGKTNFGDTGRLALCPRAVLTALFLLLVMGVWGKSHAAIPAHPVFQDTVYLPDTVLRVAAPLCEPGALDYTLQSNDAIQLSCSYKIDLNNDGSFNLTGIGKRINRSLPFGTHRFVWTYLSGSGRLKFFFLKVTVAEGDKPVVRARSVSLFLPNAQSVAPITTADINNASYDNCTAPDKLRLRLARQNAFPTDRPDTLPTRLAFGPGDLGTQWIALYAGDEAGNWDYNAQPLCIEPGDPALRNGLVSLPYRDSTGVPNVSVRIGDSTYMTLQDGTFPLYQTSFCAGGNRTIRPERNDDALFNISTYDYILLRQHVLGLKSLTTPYQLIAADVNGSGSITTQDMVELRKVILGASDRFPNNMPSWRFVPRHYVFPDTANPFASGFPEQIDAQNVYYPHFWSIKTGDIDGNAPPAPQGSAPQALPDPLVLSLPDVALRANTPATVALRLETRGDVEGFQLALRYNPALLGIQGVAPGTLEGFDQNSVHAAVPGVIRLSWARTAATVQDRPVVVQLTVLPRTNAPLSQLLTLDPLQMQPEGYDPQGSRRPLMLRYASPSPRPAAESLSSGCYPDLTSPVAICRQLTKVSLGSNGTATVAAGVFDEGSYDNCGPVWFKVRRMNTGACGSTTFDDNVTFCCSDVPGPVTVVMRVYDQRPVAGPVSETYTAGGNINECMVLVSLDDKLSPTITCPPSTTVECDAYDLNSSNLDNFYLNKYFGKVVSNPAARQQVTVNIAGDGTSKAIFIGMDGLAQDDCGLPFVNTTFSSTINTCGVGVVTRTFTATDAGGRTASCQQRITVLAGRLMTEADIRWPLDTSATTCGAALNPDNLPAVSRRPVITNPGCGLTGMTYKDLELPIELPGCKKIIRTWIVIDWCQYNVNNPLGPGRWQHDQVLKVINTKAPVFKACRDTILCQYPAGCKPLPVQLGVAATDDCTDSLRIRYTARVDLGDNGSFDNTYAGSQLNQTLPFGVHRIVWAAEDGCGNVGMCSQKVTVKDCKAPTPIAKRLTIELMPQSCMAWLDATRVNNQSYDNCTPENKLRYRLIKGKDSRYQQVTKNAKSPGDINLILALEDTVVFTREDIGRQKVALFVIDEPGNFDFTETTVDVQSNMDPGCIDTTGNLVVSGMALSALQMPVSGVQIRIDTVAAATTGPNGRFAIAGRQQGFDFGRAFTIRPVLDTNYLEGVNTLDLIRIQRHIVGADTFDQLHQLLAADVNHSGAVTLADVIELRRLILRITDRFSNNFSWRFWPASYRLTPATVFDAPDLIGVSGISRSDTFNFSGVKVGDVTTSSTGLLQADSRAAAPGLLLETEALELPAGTRVRIPFRAVLTGEAAGCQFTLGFDPGLLSVEGVQEGVWTSGHFGLTQSAEGRVHVSWDGGFDNIKEKDILFSVDCKTLAPVRLEDALRLDSRGLEAVVYEKNGTFGEVDLRLRTKNGTTLEGHKWDLYQNNPNPFNGTTVLGFYLPGPDHVKMTIFGPSGRILRQTEGDFGKGYHEMTFNASQLDARGLLFYRLDTSFGTKVRKMIAE